MYPVQANVVFFFGRVVLLLDSSLGMNEPNSNNGGANQFVSKSIELTYCNKNWSSRDFVS
jgi:hypothetical protein